MFIFLVNLLYETSQGIVFLIKLAAFKASGGAHLKPGRFLEILFP